jgi:methionyl-tRNA formyltransferase
MLACGLKEVVVLAAPKKQLKHQDSEKYYPATIRHALPCNLAGLCSAAGLRYYPVDHNDKAAIEDIVRESQCELGIIGGARIIPSAVIDLFAEGIINFHPGKIPETSGLDAFFYSIEKNVVPGVTTHYIDGRVDAGRRIWFDEVAVGADDSAEPIVENNYQLQRTCLRRLLGLLASAEPVPYEHIDRPFKNEPMAPPAKWETMKKFPAWRAREFQRQEVERLFGACEIGSVATVESMLSSAPALLNARNSNFWTPLIVSAFNQHLSLVSALLARGAQVNDSGRNGTTVLMYAKTGLLNQSSADYRLLDMLIEAGANICRTDCFGRNVIDYASAAGDERMAAYLRKRMESQNAIR